MGGVSTGPLDGLRVLDFTHVLAGPFATRIMGDLGADVVKVGSMSRPGNVPGDGSAESPTNAYYTMWNRNKRSLALDMGREEARAVCRTLCEKADIVIDNFSVGVLDRWGVGYEAVSESTPGVIYIAMSGVGTGGPWSDFVTFAPTIHAIAGLTYLTGVPDHEPIGIGSSYNDHLAGLHATVAALSAIEARRESGRGQLIDLSQFEVGANLNGIALFDYFANGRSAEPGGNRRPYDQWRALRSVFGEPPWAAEPRFDTADGRVANIDDLDAGISAWTVGRTAEEVQTLCQAAGVSAGVVQDGADLVERDPQLRHLGFLTLTEDAAPEGVPMPIDALPLHFSRTPVPRYRAHRALGRDTADVLAEWAGMSADEVAAGEANGTFR